MPSPGDSDEVNRWCDALHAAISEVMRTTDGSMLGRWVLVAESLEPDGTRTTALACPTSQAPWESLGLLEFGRMVEYGNQRSDPDA